MRVGLIIYGSIETPTGGYFYDRMLVEHLRREGAKVEIISLPPRTYGRHLLDNFSPTLLQRLRRADFDVLIQDELNHPSLFLINQMLRGRVRYPVVAMVHVLRSREAYPAWQRWFYRRAEKSYLTSVDGLIFNSQTTRKAVEELAGRGRAGVVAPPGRDHLPPAITREEVAARARRPGPLRTLFVGNVLPFKGLHVLIEALASVPSGDWHLTVIGSLTMNRGYAHTVRRQIARSGLGENVTLLGALPHAEVARHLARSHLLAVPSFYEGFGIVYLEALGFGLPVIASNAGAAREIITHGREGFLVAPGEAAALARHVRELNLDRERLLRMSLAAHERYNAHPTWAESMGRISGFLQTLSGAHSHEGNRRAGDGLMVNSHGTQRGVE
jgi:glycosyltransferase involved in cell wall biosynthesis